MCLSHTHTLGQSIDHVMSHDISHDIPVVVVHVVLIVDMLIDVVPFADMILIVAGTLVLEQ